MEDLPQSWPCSDIMPKRASQIASVSSENRLSLPVMMVHNNNSEQQVHSLRGAGAIGPSTSPEWCGSGGLCLGNPSCFHRKHLKKLDQAMPTRPEKTGWNMLNKCFLFHHLYPFVLMQKSKCFFGAKKGWNKQRVVDRYPLAFVKAQADGRLSVRDLARTTR